MKRYISAVLASAIILGLTACGGGAPQASQSSQTASPSPTRTKTSRPVPDVAGKSYPDARRALTDKGFFITIVDKSGKKWSILPDDSAVVVSTQPSSGTVTDTGDIQITVDRSEADQQAAAKAAADKATAEQQASARAAADKVAADKAAADKAAADKAAAEQAAAKAAAGTASQQNALRKAGQYLNYTAFSRSGLIGQLEYEKYSTEDATWAADRVTVDWNLQAAKKAKKYLEYTAFSRSGLVDQLIYEGFTPEQAEYGVSQTGL